METFVRRKHEEVKALQLDNFPFKSDHLRTMLFLIASELNEEELYTLNQQMILWSVRLEGYTYARVCEIMIDILQGSQGPLFNPVQRSGGRISKPARGKGKRARRTFYCMQDDIVLEEKIGMWVEEKESGYEGFLEYDRDVFWSFHTSGEHCAWAKRKFKGRRVVRRPGGKGRSNKGRGRMGYKRTKRKGRGKGRG